MDLRTHLAIAAYEAYGESVEWKNYQGNPMPTWTALGAGTQEAWAAAAVAVRTAVASIPLETPMGE